MIRKSGNRFSAKIMLEIKVPSPRRHAWNISTVHSDCMPVAAPVEMLVPPRQDRSRIEQPALGEPPLRQQLLRPGAQRTPEPLSDRQREAHLRPLDQMLRHVAVKHLTQQPFALAATHQETRRQPPGEFHDAMVEQRHPHFERDRHARAIDLGENVVGKIGGGVEILHAVERIGRAWRRCSRRTIAPFSSRPCFTSVSGSCHALTSAR